MTDPRDDYYDDDDDDYYEAVEPVPAYDLPVATPMPSEPDVPEVLPVRKGWAILAWPVIFATAAFVVAAPYLWRALPQDKAAIDRISSVIMQMQTRYAMGAAKLLGRSKTNEQFYHQLAMFNDGSVNQRLRFVVVAGEFKNASQSLTLLRELDREMAGHNHKPTPAQSDVITILTRLYTDYADRKFEAPNISPADRALLQKNLGWFGDLALANDEGPDKQLRKQIETSSQRTFAVIIGAFLVVILVAMLGLIGLVLMLVFIVQGTLRGGLRTGSGHGGVYAETFALWMLTFLGLNFGIGQLHVPDEYELAVLGCANLLSLSTLLWPVLRGIPWETVRADIGLTGGRNPLAEPFVGLGCYAMGLPILVVGVIFTLILMMVQKMIEGTPDADPFDPVLSGPTHPIIEFVASGNWWARLQVVFIASIVAPVVEEIMFRGVLYRHLREATGGLGMVLSFMLSAFWVSFIFAVIHPQGWVAVPALMSLAFAFTIGREWRGTLVPGMVAHAVNNGIIMLLLMLATGG
jgi:membrane protease YdiL (CAAX protease family)